MCPLGAEGKCYLNLPNNLLQAQDRDHLPNAGADARLYFGGQEVNYLSVGTEGKITCPDARIGETTVRCERNFRGSPAGEWDATAKDLRCDALIGI
jgi:hypothetical protein